MFKKINNNVKFPVKSTKYSDGLDVFGAEDITKDYDSYTHGMTNGMLLVQSTIYGGKC